MNVSSQTERTALIQSFRDKGFEGRVFDEKKGRFSYSSQARRFARTRVLGNNDGSLVPKGMIFDSTTNQFTKEKELLTGKRKKRLMKRFSKLGITFNRRLKALLPPANVQARMAGTVDVVLQRLDRQGNPYQFNAQYQTAVPYNKNNNANWKQQLIDELQERINNNGTRAQIVRATTQDMEYFPKANVRGIPLDSLRLRKVFLTIDGMEEQTWDTKQDQCVLDFLKWYYEDDTRLPKDMLTPEAFDFCFEENYQKEGVSTREIENWCMMAQIKMIALDEDYKVVRLYKPHCPSKAKILIYMIKNCHIHPVIDKTQIRSISETIASNELMKGKAQRIRAIIEKKRKEREELPVVIITDEMRKVGPTANSGCGRERLTNLHYLCKMMIEKEIDCLGRKITWGKSGPERFVMDGQLYVFHHKVDDVVKDFIEEKEEKFVGQKASKYVYEAMEKFNIKMSRTNAKINEIFNTENSKHKVHEGGKIVSEEYMDYFNQVAEFDWDLIPRAQTFDINKCHTSILLNPVEEWYLFSFRDEVEEYVEIDTILPGMYYVETEDKKLFMGNKFYSAAFVQFGLDEGLIEQHNIKYQIICRNLLPKDYFVGLFDEYKSQTDDTEKGIAMRKLLNNTTTGILGKTKYHVVDKWITTDIHTAYNFLIEHHEENIFNYRVPIWHNEMEYTFYCYGTVHKVLKENNNFAMYNQVLDNQAIKLYKYIKLLTDNDWNKLLHRKTDAFTINSPNEDLLPDLLGTEPGELKTESNPVYPRMKPYKDIVVDWKFYLQDWNVIEDIHSSYDYEQYYKFIDEGQSLMTCGEAGSGKSFIIKRIQEKYPEHMTLAFTNVASLRVSGATIHKTFKYDNDNETIAKATIKFLEKNPPSVIIIDEDEIIAGHLWRVLYEVKKRLKCSFLLFGDWWQLNNFDQVKYKNHMIIKSICDYNITNELEYHDNCRMDNDLRKLIQPFRQEEKVRIDTSCFKQIKNVSELPMTNICYTNACCKLINRDMNAFHYPSYPHITINKSIKDVIDAHFPKAFEVATDKNPKPRRTYEPFKPHVNMPIICVVNNHEVDEEKNGQRYKIVGFEKGEQITFDDNKIVEEYNRLIGKPLNNRKEATLRQELIKEFLFNDLVEIECLASGNKYKINILHLVLNFDPAYAMTNHKIVGDTIRDFCIHQTDFHYVDNAWSYTAFSRGTKLSDIKICHKY